MNKFQTAIIKVVTPELLKELERAQEAKSRAEYSLAIEKRNTEQFRTTLVKVDRENILLKRENRELSRKLSRLGIK